MSAHNIPSSIAAISAHPATRAAAQLSAVKAPAGGSAPSGELREAFDQFVGETFFAQMLKSMRKTVGKPAYLHGGRAEEMFQSQLDQALAQEMTAASAAQFTGPMFEQFTRQPAAAAQRLENQAEFLPLGGDQGSPALELSTAAPAIELPSRRSGIPLPPRQPFLGFQSAPRGATFDRSG